MRSVFYLILILLSVTACNRGDSRYCAVGTISSGSTTHVGCLSIVQGYPVHDGRAAGDKQNLIYLMIICSGVSAAADQGEGSGIEGDPMSRPLIYYRWETTGGTASVSLDWDAVSDTILLGDKKFNRGNENVFFIERKPDGKLDVGQCGSLGPAADFSSLAAQVRKALPDNGLISTAKFRNVDN